MRVAIGLVGFIVPGDDSGLVIGEDQITFAVILPVVAILLGAFNHGGVGVGDVPAGYVQRFAVSGGELPLAVFFGVAERGGAEVRAVIQFDVVECQRVFAFIEGDAVAESGDGGVIRRCGCISAVIGRGNVAAIVGWDRGNIAAVIGRGNVAAIVGWDRGNIAAVIGRGNVAAIVGWDRGNIAAVIWWEDWGVIMLGMPATIVIDANRYTCGERCDSASHPSPMVVLFFVASEATC